MARPRALVNSHQITETAFEMVVEEGFKRLSMRNIASRLHVSPMTLYNYVGSFDDIAHSVLALGYQTLHEQMSRSLSSLEKEAHRYSLKDVIRIVALELLYFARDYTRVYSLMFQSYQDIEFDQKILDEMYQKHLEQVVSFLPRQTDSSLRKKKDMVYLFEIMLNGVIQDQVQRKIPLDEEQFLYYLELASSKIFPDLMTA